MRSICSLLAVALLFVSLAGCDDPRLTHATLREYPTVNIPYAYRVWNWPGTEGGGSCVHASAAMLFRWQGQVSMSNYWLRTYENGEYVFTLMQKLDKEGVRYALTYGQNDVAFLEWALRTRRGAGVTVRGGTHMVLLVHLDDQWAGILDNNDPRQVKWIPREEFLNEWKNSYSWAWTPVYTPAPPLPAQ